MIDLLSKLLGDYLVEQASTHVFHDGLQEEPAGQVQRGGDGGPRQGEGGTGGRGTEKVHYRFILIFRVAETDLHYFSKLDPDPDPH
jgi:hypothetical protein